MIGASLGPYRILATLGEGGMGHVYRAHDPKLQRDVAIKVLPPDVVASPELLARLQREARMIAAVDHPNINAIYAVEEADGAPFLVLQLVEGTTLDRRLAAGPVPLEEVIDVAAQIAAALEAAHAAGVVHRDLKPANVMVTGDGLVKVLDFGLAKPTHAPGSDPDGASTELTQVGGVVGTVPYMSPEQLRGEPADARTDIWAFGCVLYEMLAGRRAFPGSTYADVSAAVIGQEPDWEAVRAAPDALLQVAQRCLRKRPDERFHEIGEVRAELAVSGASSATGSATAATSRGGVTAAPPGPEGMGPSPWSRPSTWAGAALVIALAFGAWWIASSARSSTPEASFQLTDLFLATTGPGSQSQPALSPDGSTVAFVSDESGIERIWVQTLTEGASAIPITGEDAPALQPSWSPRSDVIAFHRPDDGIWIVGPLGTPPPRRILEEGINPSFSADGRQIVYEIFPQVWVANADGTDPRPVEGSYLLMPTAVQYVVDGYPALSPDGQHIVYFRSASGPMGDFWVVPAAGGEARRLTYDTNQASHPVWTPDGRSVVFSSMRSGSRTLWRIPAEGGEPVPVTLGAGEDSEPSISRDGERFAYTNVRNERALMMFDPETGTSREILTRRYGLVSVRFSPDGSRIAFFGEVAGGTEVFVVDADGSNLRQVTEGDHQFNIHPRWSADGETIYFYRDHPYREDSPGELLRVSLAGGPGETVLRDFYWDRHMAADVHPDNDLLAYLRVDSLQDMKLALRSLETGEERLVPPPEAWDAQLPFHLTAARWSHDGRFLAGSDLSRRWRGPEGADNRVWVCTIDEDCTLVADGFWPVWSEDDARIYYYRRGSTPSTRAIWVSDRDGGNQRLVTEIGPIHPISPLFDVAPDGRIVWVQDRPGSQEVWTATIR